MKVLVASPIYDRMEYCFQEFLEHLKNIDYNNFDILIVDNSRSKKFWRKIRKFLSSQPNIKVIHDDTKEEKNLMRVVSSRNKILDYARKKNYDYLLMMDSDVMVPLNILKKLISENKDVISGLYFNYFQIEGKTMLLPVCYKDMEEENFEEMKKKGKIPEDKNKKEDYRRCLFKKEIREGKTLEVRIPSAGCVLLSKKVLDSGARYGLLENVEVVTSDDVYFFRKLRELGFKLYCNPSVLCKHHIGEKLVDGKNLLYD